MAEEDKKEVLDIESVLRKDFTVRLLLKNELKTEEGTGYFSTITSMDTVKKSFYLSPPVKGELEISLPPGDEVLIHYYGPEALYEFKAKFIGIPTRNEIRQYEFQIPEKGSRIQRRSFFRLPIRIKADYRLLHDELTGSSVKFTPSSPYFPCDIDNISGGGLSLYSNTLIEEEAFVEIRFELFVETGGNPLIEIVKIVHVHSTPGKESPGHHDYQYGGYFLKMKERTREEIIHFINKKQSERLKKGG